MITDKDRARAKNNAYSLLRVRPRSEAEIRRRLELKGYDGEIIDYIVASLKKSGDIDDVKFAKFFVDSRMHMNPAGDVVLRYELKEKGVSESIVDAVLEEKSKNYDEYGVAFDMASERFARFKKLDRPKAIKRVYDFLLRRGFQYDTVRKIVEELAKKR